MEKRKLTQGKLKKQEIEKIQRTEQKTIQSQQKLQQLSVIIQEKTNQVNSQRFVHFLPLLKSYLQFLDPQNSHRFQEGLLSYSPEQEI